MIKWTALFERIAGLEDGERSNPITQVVRPEGIGKVLRWSVIDGYKKIQMNIKRFS